MIRRLLVPNRGEIAVRIARTAREMGIESVLAFAEDDDNRCARRAFDEVVSLGEGDVRATYLNVEKIIAAARSSNCDAIHPGYGFLSERSAPTEVPRGWSERGASIGLGSDRRLGKIELPDIPLWPDIPMSGGPALDRVFCRVRSCANSLIE